MATNPPPNPNANRVRLDMALRDFRNPYSQSARFANSMLMRYSSSTLDDTAVEAIQHNSRLVENGTIPAELGHVREVPILLRNARREWAAGNRGSAGLFWFGSLLNATIAPLFVPSMYRHAQSGRSRHVLLDSDSLFPGTMSHDDFPDNDD